MYLLFLDESGRLDQGGLFALGGIAVGDADWQRSKSSGKRRCARRLATRSRGQVARDPNR